MNKYRYKTNVIWTNHALERIGQRGLTQELAYKAFTEPDITKKSKDQKTTEFQKKIGKSIITIIAKQNEQKEWIDNYLMLDRPAIARIDR